MKTQVTRLLVISHVAHYQQDGKVYSWGPYAREIDIWADLFPQIVIASPLRPGPPPKDCLPYMRSNISLVPQRDTGGNYWLPKLLQILMLPVLIWDLVRLMRSADAIHVRCPGNLGLLGIVLAPMFSRFVVAKYAGQWNGYHNEPITVRLQRWLLRSAWWRRGVVTVYGEWPDQPKQIVPFFTSMMTASQVRRSAEVAREKRLTYPPEILYSGRLAGLKGIDVLLRAAAALAGEGLKFRLTIIGDGAEAGRLRALTKELGLSNVVQFTGALPFEEVMHWYERGHILVLPSRHSEGWPKVLAEAMCHGLVCISTDHGLIPWLLRDKGYVFPVDDTDALAAHLRRLMQHPDEYLDVSRAASAWATNYSLESLRDALRELLSNKWAMPVTRVSNSKLSASA